MTAKKKTINQNRGNSRAAQNRKIRQDAMREELKAKEYVRKLLLVLTKLNPKAKNAYKSDELPMVKESIDIYKFLINKYLPSRKPVDRFIDFELPTIESFDDVTKAVNAIMQGIAVGKVTPNEAKDMNSILESYTKIIQLSELQIKMNKIEELLDAEI